VLVLVYFLLHVCSCLWVGRVLVYYWFFFPALKTKKKLSDGQKTPHDSDDFAFCC